MWPLTNGNRCLVGPEAELFRGTVAMMVDQLVDELNPAAEVEHKVESDPQFTISGPMVGFDPPHWYEMWEPEQKIWLLERVATSLLTSRPAPAMAAMFEATVEAVYVETGNLIVLEITEGRPIEPGSWRQSLLDAYVQRCPRDSFLEATHFEATTLDPCLPREIEQQIRQLEQTTASEGDLNSNSIQDPNSIQGSVGKRKSDWLTYWSTVIERLLDATYGPRVHHTAEAYRDGDPKLLKRFLQSKGVSPKFLQRIPPLRTNHQIQKAVTRLQALLLED
ncbi:hypothetical protein RISK_003730 [Rhodopirellula islandica]|uniref:Uncharacterized protein n=1 Tax=Rhodopirellula islandica TaxID=595434 RepID=A0A0J1EF43_RHOIS|nr:hypothetical protein [Rhodopirellula islandica]KLU04144.1 hypothetical protein RISK_003730 [Rhodopirellula islandica]